MKKALEQTISMVAERKEGLMLVAKVKPLVNGLIVNSPESYLAADDMLGFVRSKRAAWKLKMSKILDPLKEALNASKRAYKASEDLYEEIDTPMAESESSIKKLMGDFKLEERKQIAAAREEQRKAEAELQRQLVAKEEAERKAKTPAMVNKILESKARIQQALAETKAEEAPTAIKGGSSIARTVKKWRVTDMRLLLVHITEMSLEDISSLVQIDRGQMESYFRLSKPEVGVWLPGVEVYEEVNIAGR